jgi:hypothetical protein
MSDAKAKRPTRDSARSEAAATERTLAVSEPTVDAAAPAADNASQAAASETPASVAAIAASPHPAHRAEPTPAEPAPAVASDAWTTLTEVQSALARACEETAAQVGDITRSGIAAGTDAALALLGARTFAEAIEINAGLAQRGFDAIVAGSAKLTEIGVKAMTAASRPVVAQLSAGWKTESR